MNTIQITEESAIIPLAKLNEYKELQMLINGIVFTSKQGQNCGISLNK